MTHTERMTMLVTLATAAVEADKLKRAEEAEAALAGYRLAVADAAGWCAETLLGREAAELLDWQVTDPDVFSGGLATLSGGIAEAAVVIPTEPHSLLLAFRAPQGEAGSMADAGCLVLIRECGDCRADHVHEVSSLRELGELLAKHRAGELKDVHDAPAAQPVAPW
ncbi:hypothetical protein ACF1HU_35870 [Streptomyces olivaceus]|uniref:hypothetical protein n=1 Tax=Streptomyces olivaceus TaxID=47716 RepID=UPI0036F98225